MPEPVGGERAAAHPPCGHGGSRFCGLSVGRLGGSAPAGERGSRFNTLRRLFAEAVLLVAAVLVLASSSLGAAEADRFPRPEFRETQYVAPVSVHPPARSEWLEVVDLAVLAGALALAAWLALRRRSRRGLAWLALGSIAYFGFWRQGCVCPVGSLQNIARACGDASALLPWGVIALFALPLLAALFVGRVFCAAVCPLGAVQESVLVKPLRVPLWIDRPLRMVPYVYLGLAVLFAATGAGFLICRHDPFIGIFRLSAPLAMAVAAGAMLLLSTVVGRPYCRYLCPYGALLNLASRVSKWHLTITPDRCVNCRLCEAACPYGAIMMPEREPLGERRPRERRVLAAALVGTPLLMLLGAGAGSALSVHAAASHPLVQTVAALGQGEPRTLLSRQRLDAFHQSGISEEMLRASAREAEKRIGIGAIVAGGALGLVAGATLLGLTIRRRRDGYEPDRGLCVSCGRCFASCPRDGAARRTATEKPEAKE